MNETVATTRHSVHPDTYAAVVTQAGVVSRLDARVRSGHRAEMRIGGEIADLAEQVLLIMAADPDYTLPPAVKSALGGAFCENELLVAAEELGWMTSEFGGFPSETDSCPEGLRARISAEGQP